MAGNLIYITDAGRAALVAPGNTGTNAHQVTQIGLATAAFVFKPDMTALPSELKRITTFGGDTVAKDTIHIVIQDDTADQYKLYGFGLYLDNGVLFGVYVQNDPILEKAATSMLLLAADTVFASIDVTKLVFGPTSFLNPPATTERKGVVELATQAEVDDGADDTRAVTPKTAASRYAALTGARFTGNISAAGGIASTGLDTGGANFRLMNGRDVILRNDGSNFFLLLTDSSGIAASWNSYRPVTVNMKTGAVMLDDTGAGTYVGGQLAVKGMLNVSNGANEARMLLGPSGGYFFGTNNAAGFYLPSTGAMFAFDFAKKNLTVVGNEVWNAGNLPNPAQTTGITMSGQFLAAEGTVSKPGISFVNDGAPDTGFFHISDGVFAVANNGRETMRFLSGDNNRVLIGMPVDDGSMLQVAGNAATRGLHRFGNGTTTAWVTSDAAWGFFRSSGHVSIGSEGANGVLQLVAGNAEVARFYPGGRMTIGGIADDGTTTIQSKGAIKAIGAVGAFVATNGGGDKQTSIILRREGAAVDQKQWEILHGGDGAFTVRAVNDGYNRSQDVFYVTRAAGIAAGNMGLMPNGGRVLIGTTSDDGRSALQANGHIASSGGIVARGMDASGANFRAVNGQYGAFLRNDGTVVYLLSTKAGDADGLYNDFRPFSWNLASGDVTIAGNGSSTVVGGSLTALGELKIKPGGEGVIRAGSNDGYFFGNLDRAGWYSPTKGSFQYYFTDRVLKVNDKVVWHEGNLTPLDRNLGGQVNGTVTLYGAGEYGSQLVLNANGYAPRIQAKASTQEWMVTNGANSAANLVVSDNGVVNFPRARPQWAGGLTPFDTGNFDPNSKVNKAGDTMTGDLRVKQPNNTDARGFVVARADGTAQAWFHGTMNGNYSAWATMNPDGSWKSNPITVYNDDNRVVFNSDIHVTTNSRFYSRPTLNRDGWQADIGLRNNRPGYDSWTYLRARDGGGMEIINSAYNAVTWSVDDWGTMYMRGQQILNTDGNLRLAFRGGVWLSDQLGNIDNALNSKAGAGARVQWDSGVNNFGTVDRLNGALPAPWVVCGLSGPGNGTANAIVVYGVVLRNQ
ncbi:Putative phage tail fiber protein [Burkholderia cenocepacia]|uniref:phage tail fiber protein n=2 Tax=Burkholderia cepacia complex TaxID=87882 RepID=UPI001A3D3A71|nr:phage tail protein [Burkholderia cenocepacia]CAD9219274.1 Putative phage tail fiber protein [Burkholderia cenocepacia]